LLSLRDPRRGLSLRSHLVGLVVLVAILAGVGALVVRARAYDDARTSALKTEQLAASQATADLVTSLRALRDTVALTATTPGLAKVFVDAKGCRLNFVGAGGFVSGRLEIVRADGVVVCSSRPITAASRYARSGLLRTATARSSLLAPVRDPVTGAWTVLAVSRIPSGGFVAGSFDLQGLGAGLVSQFGGGRQPEFLVLSADGRTVLARSIDPSRWVARSLARTPAAPPKGAGAHRDLDGRSRLYGSAVVAGYGWRVYAGEGEQQALAEAATRFHRDLLAIAIGLALVLAAALFVHRLVARPIVRLSTTVRAAADEHTPDGARGDTPPPADPVRTHDLSTISGPIEIVGLARDFDHLIRVVEQELAARRESEAALRRSLAQHEATDAQRRRLLKSLVSAQEEERRRIASDVHDDSIQVMAAAVMRIGIIRDGLRDEPGLDEQLGRLQETCEQTIYRLRHLLFQLRPPSLDRAGLAVALDEYLQQWTAEAGLEYRLNDALTNEPPPDTRAVIFRIAQEALTNVRKHAHASLVTVTLEDRPPGVLLRIDDDGTGFTEQDRSKSGIDHFGLISMRERADIAGGWWSIESDGASGTTVEAWVPLSTDSAVT
jgi:signal transduction histidine kinase